MMKWLALVLIINTSVPVYAEGTADQESVHFAAHFGLSYAISAFAYGVFHKGMRMDRTDAFIMSAMLTFTGGVFRQGIESIQHNAPVNTKGIWQNAAGIGAFGMTSYMFEF